MKDLLYENSKHKKNISNNTNAILFYKNKKYYIIDGHHRIAANILKGDNKIKAFIFKS